MVPRHGAELITIGKADVVVVVCEVARLIYNASILTCDLNHGAVLLAFEECSVIFFSQIELFRTQLFDIFEGGFHRLPADVDDVFTSVNVTLSAHPVEYGPDTPR